MVSRAVLFISVMFFARASAQQYGPEIERLSNRLNEMEAERANVLAQMEDLKLRWVATELEQRGLSSLPKGSQLVRHSAMILSYNEEHEQADWVAHIILPDVETGRVSRTNDFRTDPAVSTGTAEQDDYWESGFDRGHLAPSADFRWSEKALSESYFYSNMSPQRPELNRKVWGELEDWVRRYVIDFKKPVVVVTGGVLTSGLPTLGENKVTIPKYYFKAILDPYGDMHKAIAFVMENRAHDYPVISYAVSIDSVERLTGLDLFTQLADDEEKKLEAMCEPKAWLHDRNPESAEVAPIPVKDLPKGMFNSIQAKYQVGSTATVCGTVVATHRSKKDAVYLNFDRRFPNNAFYATVWKDRQNNFSYELEKELLNRRVCVTGKVTVYDEVARLSINSENQVIFLDDAKNLNR
jgi:endonuclease G